MLKISSRWSWFLGTKDGSTSHDINGSLSWFLTLKNFLKQVSGNFIVRDSRGGYAVYTSKTEGPNNLSFYSNMTVTYSYPDKDEDGDAVLVIVIDSWDN